MAPVSRGMPIAPLYQWSSGSLSCCEVEAKGRGATMRVIAADTNVSAVPHAVLW